MEFLEEEFCTRDYGDIEETMSSESLSLADNDGQTTDFNAAAFGESIEVSVDGIEEPIVVPKVGMIFSTEQDAYDYYNSYARSIGFGVRMRRLNKKKNTGVIWKRLYTCSREGFYEKKNTPKKKRDERRCGCEAKFEIRLQEDGKFGVTAFSSEHNHDLVPPSISHALRSHRSMESSQAGLVNQMVDAGFKSSQIYRYMTVEAGGHQNLNFTQTDCNNFIQRRRAAFLKKGDANCLLAYFKEKKVEDESFYYAIRTNDENVITGCFYCDGKSRKDYELFGDAVAFDTTFKTNNYGMVCAPIVGINHHGQTVLFGCGLLDGETTEACTWLFEEFVQAMAGKKPKTIFTDQAASIAAAIREVFPNAHHRFCLWHIFQNAAKHLSHVYQKFSTFSQDFRSCVYDPESIEEFESSWKYLLDNYDLCEDLWLQSLYKVREKWAQVYGRSNFCAGMTTTQRSESINRFLKKFFSRNLYLREWVRQYELALDDRREKERLAEVATSQTKRISLSNWKVEVEAAKRYTKSIFYHFQDEYKKCLDLKLELERDDGIIQTYAVERPGNPCLRRTLSYSPSNQSVLCSCKRFEFEGILCSHALKLFRELAVSSLPLKYYRKRWRRDARRDVDLESSGKNKCAPTSFSTVQYSHLSQIAQRIVAKAARDKKTSTLVESKLLALEAELNGNLHAEQEHGGTNGDMEIRNEMPENNANLVLRDPQVKRRKARGKGGEKNVFGSKNQAKRSDQSIQKEDAVPNGENTTSVPKKRRGSSKRKDNEESNSRRHDISDAPLIPQQHVQGSKKQAKHRAQSMLKEHKATVPSDDNTTSLAKRRKTALTKKDVEESNSNRYEISSLSYPHPYVQESFGLVNQSQQHAPFLCPTSSGVQGIPSNFIYTFPSPTPSAPVMPYQSHVYQVGGASAQTILNQALGIQIIPPVSGNFSTIHSQETTHPRPQGSARQLNFGDPSTS